jgi:hypothetical protein
MALYDEVVSVSKTYLGPATEQFLARQCKILKLDARAITNKDLAALAKWVEIGAGMVMDPGKAKELALKVKSL